MTVAELLKLNVFKVINEEGDTEKTITVPYCCDLLSIAMSKSPAGAAWVTVMGNVNTLAVASLTDAAVVVLAEAVTLDEAVISKAKEQGIIVLASDRPIYDTARQIEELMNA